MPGRNCSEVMTQGDGVRSNVFGRVCLVSVHGREGWERDIAFRTRVARVTDRAGCSASPSPERFAVRALRPPDLTTHTSHEHSWAATHRTQHHPYRPRCPHIFFRLPFGTHTISHGRTVSLPHHAHSHVALPLVRWPQLAARTRRIFHTRRIWRPSLALPRRPLKR